MAEAVAYCTLNLRENVQFDIAIGLEDDDLLSRQLLDGTYLWSPAFRFVFELLRPGDTVIDLGAHIGTFSLAAAALGCRVLAVEASEYNAGLLRAGARRNAFDRVHVVCAAVSDREGTVEFVSGGPYGFVAGSTTTWPTVPVPAKTVDELLDELGWDRVDLIKMDVEGSEIAAIGGMRRLLSRPDAPPILYESNGHSLALWGRTTGELRAALEGYGYQSYLIEPEQLIPMRSSDFQPECVADYFAARTLPELPAGWQVTPLSLAHTVAKIASYSVHPHKHFRMYLARALAGAGAPLLSERRVWGALERLLADPHQEVCAAASWWAVEREKLGAESAGLPETFGLASADLDVEAIMQEIRARIRARRAEAWSRGLDFEAYADGLYPLPEGAVLSRDAYEAVRTLGLGWDKVGVEMMLTETRLPVFGWLVRRLRAALHELVLFYVNRLASRQARVNEQTARALVALVRDLEAEVGELRARLAALEGKQ